MATRAYAKRVYWSHEEASAVVRHYHYLLKLGSVEIKGRLEKAKVAHAAQRFIQAEVYPSMELRDFDKLKNFENFLSREPMAELHHEMKTWPLALLGEIDRPEPHPEVAKIIEAAPAPVQTEIAKIITGDPGKYPLPPETSRFAVKFSEHELGGQLAKGLRDVRREMTKPSKPVIIRPEPEPIPAPSGIDALFRSMIQQSIEMAMPKDQPLSQSALASISELLAHHSQTIEQRLAAHEAQLALQFEAQLKAIREQVAGSEAKLIDFWNGPQPAATPQVTSVLTTEGQHLHRRADDPKPKQEPRIRLPHCLIYGLKPNQQNNVKADFANRFEFTFFQEKGNSMRAAAKAADWGISVIKFNNHSVEDVMHAVLGKKMIRANGSTSSVKAALEKILIAIAEEKAAAHFIDAP